MNLPSLADFKSEWIGKGCSEVLEREWTPNQVVEEHSHPFKADALLVQGEMWLTVDGHTQHLGVGDTFHLEAHTAHSERYGPHGAVYWVARTNAV